MKIIQTIFISVIFASVYCASTSKKATSSVQVNDTNELVKLHSTKEMIEQEIDSAAQTLRESKEALLLADTRLEYLKNSYKNTPLQYQKKTEHARVRDDLQLQQSQAQNFLKQSREKLVAESYDEAFSEAKNSNQLAKIILEQTQLFIIMINKNITEQNAQQPRIHIVKKREPITECLWNISKKYYGSGKYWRDIYKYNQKQISNPNLVSPGQKLIIPNLHFKRTGSLPTSLDQINNESKLLEESDVQYSDHEKSQKQQSQTPVNKTDDIKKLHKVEKDPVYEKNSESLKKQQDSDQSKLKKPLQNQKILKKEQQPVDETGNIEFRVDEHRLILPKDRFEEDPLLLELEKNIDQYLLETE